MSAYARLILCSFIIFTVTACGGGGGSTTDTTKPVITLTGLSTVNVEFGSSYVDAGATASDNIDGDITVSITPTSTVDDSVSGTYTVTYNVIDASGNAAVAIVRTVNIGGGGELSSENTFPIYTDTSVGLPPFPNN